MTRQERRPAPPAARAAGPAALSLWLRATEPLISSALVAARVFNLAWSLLFIGSLMHILLRLSPSRLFALAAGGALLCVEIARLPLQTARNDMMPLALALLVRSCPLSPA